MATPSSRRGFFSNKADKKRLAELVLSRCRQYAAESQSTWPTTPRSGQGNQGLGNQAE